MEWQGISRFEFLEEYAARRRISYATERSSGVPLSAVSRDQPGEAMKVEIALVPVARESSARRAVAQLRGSRRALQRSRPTPPVGWGVGSARLYSLGYVERSRVGDATGPLMVHQSGRLSAAARLGSTKERCPSGRRSATGNRVGAERCLEGSNPSLSAQRGESCGRMRDSA